MPLTRRNVSPVRLNREVLPSQVQRDELECVANRTIANLIRQLGSLSKHAEHIFGEMYHETMRLDHKTAQLSSRVERLGERLQHIDSLQHDGTLDELEMRKAFKSSSFVDQRTLDRETLPSALVEQYEKCAPPPNLDLLNPYRESRENALTHYTNPSFFFDLWRSEILKECGEMRPQGQKRRSPRKQKHKRDQDDNNRLVSSLGRKGALSFPDEYQAPAALGIQRREWKDREEYKESQSIQPLSIPHGMSRPTMHQHHHINNVIEPVSSLIGVSSIDDNREGWMKEIEGEEEDDALPPPPPQLMNNSTIMNNQIVGAPIELMEMEVASIVPISSQSTIPPPPPPPPPPQISNAVASFASAAGSSVTPRNGDNNRSDLLAEIHAGHKLRKVRLEEEAAAAKEDEGGMDVAAILKKRMEQVYGIDDDDDDDYDNDDEEDWD